MIYLGDKKIGKIYLGSTPIGKAYLGGTLVYQSAPAGYSVVYALTNVTSSNTDTTVAIGGSYTTTLTAATYYSISTVTVTMGGIDITATAYSNGVVTIADVTADVTITASATYKYTGWIRVNMLSKATAGTATPFLNSSFSLNYISNMEIDGTAVTVARSYTFDDTSQLHDIFIQLANNTAIPASMFYINSSDPGMKLIDIPDTLTSVGNSAFRSVGKSAAAKLISRATSPPTASQYTFNATNNLVVYVPDNSVTAYQAANYWKNKTINPLSDL